MSEHRDKAAYVLQGSVSSPALIAEAHVSATLYVGDQLARIADSLDAVCQKPSPPVAPGAVRIIGRIGSL